MLRILPNHTIDCCDPFCDAQGITSDRADLPPGWTFKRTILDEEDQVGILIFCPECSRRREQDIGL